MTCDTKKASFTALTHAHAQWRKIKFQKLKAFEISEY